MKLFFSGRNVPQALLAAARHFQLAPEEIEYTLRDRDRGFIKSPRAVIEVDPAAPRRSGAATPIVAAATVSSPGKEEAPKPPSAAAPRRSGRPPKPSSGGRENRTREPRGVVSPEALGAARECAVQLARFAGLEVEARVGLDPAASEVLVEFEGADAKLLAANQGELLETIDHLLPRLLRGMTGESYLCRIDAAGFRAAREADLQRLALEAAQTVRREGRPLALPEMNPAERRIVHLTLEKDPSVTTASQGDGFLKSITVSPA
jgi:spoIIIJ-associated protein